VTLILSLQDATDFIALYIMILDPLPLIKAYLLAFAFF